MFERTGISRGDIPGIAWPPLHSQKTAPIAALVHAFDQSQWLDAETIAQNQRSQLAATVRRLDEASQVFADFLANAGLTPRAFASEGTLQTLPILTRRDAQRRLGGRPDIDVPGGHLPLAKHSSSGSTGEPVTVWRTAVNTLDWLAMTIRYYHWSGADFSDRHTMIRALSLDLGQIKDWGMPVGLLNRTGPLLILDIQDDVESLLAALHEFRPQCLSVYPATLSAILDRIDLPDLTHILTIGETLSPQLRADVKARLGIDIHDCYSAEEVGYIAIRCPDSGLYHTMDELLIVEVLREDGSACAAGETGRVVVTDLRNQAMPILRYDTGDYAERGPPCPCARGLGTLARVAGRERNMVLKPDGSRHWPLTGFRRYREVAPVLQYQMIQDGPDHIEMIVVPERPLTGSEEEALRQIAADALGYPFAIDFTYREGRLPPGRNGKFEEFVSRIGQKP